MNRLMLLTLLILPIIWGCVGTNRKIHTSLDGVDAQPAWRHRQPDAYFNAFIAPVATDDWCAWQPPFTCVHTTISVIETHVIIPFRMDED